MGKYSPFIIPLKPMDSNGDSAATSIDQNHCKCLWNKNILNMPMSPRITSVLLAINLSWLKSGNMVGIAKTRGEIFSAV